MKTALIISTCVLVALAACTNSRAKDKQEQETPKALQDKNTSSEIVYKRRHDDIVEGLYNELAEKTPELKQLEDQIDNLRSSEGDSTDSFVNYNVKNESYFNSADHHAGNIKDSVLRGKIKLLIANSVTKYNSSISLHNDLLKSIATKDLTLRDLHVVLKITRTLPVIGKYQKDNLPSTESLKGFSKALDKTIKYADTLTKQ
jgi:hypothetical protein